MPKFKAARGAGGQEKHAPLAEQILAGEAVRAGAREKRRGRGTGDEEEEYVGPRLTRRILQQARQQQEELEAEHGSGDRPAPPRERTTRLGEWRGWGTRRRVGSWGGRLKGVRQLGIKKKKKKMRALAKVMGWETQLWDRLRVAGALHAHSLEASLLGIPEVRPTGSGYSGR